MRFSRFAIRHGAGITLVAGALILPGPVSASPIAAQLYQDHCSVCHGDRGDGRSRARQGLVPPPKDFTRPGLGQHMTRERMINSVRDGLPGTAMVGWKSRLSDSEIAAIVDHIRASFMQSVSAHALKAPAQRMPERPPHTAARSSRGAQIYGESCSVCHGDQGAGSLWASGGLKPPPRDFTRATIARDSMIAAVTNGRPGTAMPSFAAQLSPTDVAAVVDFIRDNLMPKTPAGQPATTSAGTTTTMRPIAYDAPLPAGLSGNAARGRSLYNANCATCHGERGDGAGPRAYFIFPKPRNFLDPAVRKAFDRKALYHATRNGVIGREMPAWGKVFSDQQIADVTEYVYQAFIRPGVAASR